MGKHGEYDADGFGTAEEPVMPARKARKPRGKALSGPAAQAARAKVQADNLLRKERDAARRALEVTPPRWEVVVDDLWTNTWDMAPGFGVRHDEVYGKAMQLIEMKPELAIHTFLAAEIDVVTEAGQVRKQRVYKMKQRGFVLLSGRFTTPRAVEIQQLWIDDYERLQAIVKRGGGQVDTIGIANAVASAVTGTVERLMDQQRDFMREMFAALKPAPAAPHPNAGKTDRTFGVETYPRPGAALGGVPCIASLMTLSASKPGRYGLSITGTAMKSLGIIVFR